MANVINTNVKSILAQNAMTTNNRSLEKTMQQLSTGKRINGAADDAAGLAISEKMTGQIRGLNQGVRNANDGISMMQTAEGALIETTNMLQRMRELAVQSATGSLDNTQRGYLNAEYKALGTAINNVANSTTWNGMKILAGTLAGSAKVSTVTFQVGANNSADNRSTVTFKRMTASNGGVFATSASMGSIATVAVARTAMDSIDKALDRVASHRATLGATINQLTYAADNLANVSMNTSASRSRILDTDYAQATTELARTQIIAQAATAMLAQANQQPQSVLSLLK